MPKPKLTVKQAKFVKAKAEGKTGTEAAMIAYDVKDETVASAISSENLRKPSIQQAVQESMAKQGLTIDLVVKPIVDGMTASKDFYDKEGNYIDSTPDHSTRLKASGMALELMGAKNKGDTTVNINFNQHMTEQKDKYGL